MRNTRNRIFLGVAFGLCLCVCAMLDGLAARGAIACSVQ